MHGHVSRIHHAGDALFAGVSPLFQATRYHSLMAVDLPPELDPIAWDDDGLIMAVRHRDWAAWGVQFHPESIASEYGATIVANFLLLTGGRCAASPAEPLVVSSPGSSPVDPSGDSGHGRDLHVRWLELSAVPDPVAAMTALFTTDEQAFWIDTLATDQHERPARYSYIGAAVSPASETVSYRIADGFVAVCRTGGPTTMVPGSTFDYLDGQLSQRSVEAVSPVPLNLGYVGWLGYELRELVGAPHGRCSPHPDAFLALADRMLVIDHEASRAWLATLANADKRGSADAWIKAGKSALEGLRAAPPLQIPGAARMPLVSYRHDVAAYLDLIARCQEHIRAGESYELCLTNQLRVAAAVDPFILFRVLRHLSPAPFSAYFRAPGVAVVGASPERFLTVQDGVLHSKPMKGTRPRGADSATAHSLREELHASPKERAENLMIRRPRTQRLGSVAQPASVSVEQLFDVETYPHVHQMVSTVRASLSRHRTVVDVIRATFPGGSRTGAPKRRSTEILDELEGDYRGIYSGVLGFITPDRRIDLSMVIRTAIVTSRDLTIEEVAEMFLKGEALLEAVAATLALQPR